MFKENVFNYLPNFKGHFKMEAFDKDGTKVEEYEDPNVVVNGARQVMAAMMSGVVNKNYTNPINVIKIGNMGVDSNNNPLTPTVSDVSLYSESAINAGAGGTTTNANFVGTIASGVLSVSSISGTLSLGNVIIGAGVPTGTYIKALGTGTGGVGTYNLSSNITIATATSMTSSIPFNWRYQFDPSQTANITTNITSYNAQFTASINSGQLTVTNISSGTINIGDTIVATGITGTVTITGIISGTVGSIGVYSISYPVISVASELMNTYTLGAGTTSTIFTSADGRIMVTYSSTSIIYSINIQASDANKTGIPFVSYSEAGLYSSSTASTVIFNGSISSSTLTVSSVSSGTLLVGQYITGTGVTPGTYITALGTGTGGVGTYNLSQISSVSNESMTAGAVTDTLWSKKTYPIKAKDNLTNFVITWTLSF